MFVNAIQVTEYETAAGPYHSVVTSYPTWEFIETAIRNLDRCGFPFVWLYRNANPQHGDMPDMDVVGGLGEYAIIKNESKDGDYSYLTFVDMQRSSKDVDIWVSDQGTTMAEFQLCPDLERTLLIVRLFCETGQLHPQADWMET